MMQKSLKAGSITCALISIVLLAACEATDVGATYRLVRAGADTLPVLMQQEGLCGHMLRGGEVLFYGTRRYISSFTVHRECPGRPPEKLPEIGTSGRLRITRDTAFFSDSLGNRTGFGVLKPDSLVVQGERHRLVYHRIEGR